MRKPMLAGNWKMNKTRDEALQFIYALGNDLPSADKVESVICAPSIILRDLVKRSPEALKIGAQNMHDKDSGAYTGEISPVMLKDTGVTYVILGHSERRQYFNETDEIVNLKIKKAIEIGLKPIVCVGESLEERESNKTNDVLKTQITKAFMEVKESNLDEIVIAYEPIWAIGTGKTASSEMADEACGYIRSLINDLYGDKASNSIRILYGGSVSTKNVEELMSMPNIDGGLVGGASLKADSFLELCNACAK